MVTWYDENGVRQRRSRTTLKEADSLIGEIEKTVKSAAENPYTADDRQIYNLAREIASGHGFTVLEAMREWEVSKAPFKGKTVTSVIEELIAAKTREQLSAPYVNRLRDDLKSFAKDAPDHIERVTSAEIKKFLDSCEVGARRWNNMRDQIVTLFRFAKQCRYLPRDRSTEAEDVTKLKVRRQTVETYTPEEFKLMLDHTRENWLPWILLSGYTGVRTFEVMRMEWSCIRWEQKLIDLPPTVTKVNERRIIPMCPTLVEKLQPWRNEKGLVCAERVPQREVEQIVRKLKEKMPKFAWKHNALRHSYGSFRTALTQNVPQVALEMGNSLQMVKRHYLEAQTFEEGIAWFGVQWPVATESKSKDPFLRWIPG